MKNKKRAEKRIINVGVEEKILHGMFTYDLPENVTFKSTLKEHATWTCGVVHISKRNSKRQDSEVVLCWHVRGTLGSQMWLNQREKGRWGEN